MIYRFGDYRVDTARFEISRRGRPVTVEPQVLELLIVLLDNRDHVVSRDALLSKIWKDRVVSDTTLSSRIKSARQAIGDDGNRQDYIKTIHGRGFRFVGAVEVEAAPAAEARPAPALVADRPTTHYARSGEVHVAYHLFGDGPVNLVLAPGFVSHIDNFWDNPQLRYWLERLGRLARVAMFDKRGTGLSDPVGSLPGMDERMDDLRAVMDAAGFQTAFIMGVSEGGSLATLYAAHHPERCDGLILYGAFAQFKHWFPDEAALQRLFDYIETDWGSGRSLPQFAPSVADDPEFVRWWGQFERLGATPGTAISLMRMNSRIDISDVLPSIQVPTLVIHVAHDVLIDNQAGRDLARQIPGAQYVEIPGIDHLPMVGHNPERIIEAVTPFLKQPRRREQPSRTLATILLIRVDAEAGTDAYAHATRAVTDELRRFHASHVAPRAGDIVATFDGSARALECALAIGRLLQASARDYRIAIHTGDLTVEGGRLEGKALQIAADVGEHARRNEILASRTVNDLVAGSGIPLHDRGEYHLPSIAQAWHLFQVEA